MTPDPEPPDFPDVPVVEAAAADQVAAHAGEAPGHHDPIHTHCENCGTKLEGPFCHKCGQHDFDFKQGFGHALHDALENFFHFDTKLFRNTVTLLFRPGVLSAEFNAGRRVAQMPPLRLYIFVSILFFFISFTSDRIPKDNIIQQDAPKEELRIGAGPKLKNILVEAKTDSDKSELAEKNAQTLQALGDDKVAPADATEKTADQATPKKEKAHKPKDPKSELEKTLEEKGEYAYRHQHELAEAFVHAIPKMLLFCLPLFALYTRVLFRKAGLAYLQHLVVAIHFHTFIFIWLLFRDGWAGLAGLFSASLHGWIVFFAGVWLTIYPLLMLRRLFANSWKRTFFKTVALAMAYALTLGLAFGITAMIVFASL
jgi:hypothetical protein